MTLVSPHLDAVRELAARGLSNPEIAAKLGVSRQTVWKTRRRHGIPDAAPSNPPAAESLEAAFYQRTYDVGGGHLDWDGPRTTSGVGTFTHAGIVYGAARAAFTIHTGRQPVGSVKAECGRKGCVAPGHVEDAPGRARARATYRAVVLDLPAPAEQCRNGHDRAEHGRFDADGDAYCAECQRTAAARRLASSQEVAA